MFQDKFFFASSVSRDSQTAEAGYQQTKMSRKHALWICTWLKSKGGGSNVKGGLLYVVEDAVLVQT